MGAAFPVVAPDAFGAHRGFAYHHYGRRDVTTFLAGHVTFGSLLGVFYPLLHPALALHAAW